MNVSLTPELERFVETEVGSGMYQTASEVIRAGLRRLKEDRQRLPAVPQTVAELEKALLSSLDRLDHGEGVDGATVLRRLQKRIREHRSRG